MDKIELARAYQEGTGVNCDICPQNILCQRGTASTTILLANMLTIYTPYRPLSTVHLLQVN